MLQVIIPAIDELWDEHNNQFISIKEQKLQLEHSLVSLSKWESKWEKPFLTQDQKTHEESVDYVRCMTITQNVDPLVYEYIPDDVMDKINEYIAKPMTATWINDDEKGKSTNEQITNELVYYWMIEFKIPIECQKWHLNHLLTLIRVCNHKNKPPKKRSTKEIMSENSRLNKLRRAQLNSKG